MTKNEIKKLELTIEKIDKLLEKEGFTGLRVQNFKMKGATVRTCLKWKLVKRADGTIYRKCVDWSPNQ